MNTAFTKLIFFIIKSISGSGISNSPKVRRQEANKALNSAKPACYSRLVPNHMEGFRDDIPIPILRPQTTNFRGMLPPSSSGITSIWTSGWLLSLNTVLDINPSKSSNASCSAALTVFKRHGTGRSLTLPRTDTKPKAGSIASGDVTFENKLSKSDMFREEASEDPKSRCGLGVSIEDASSIRRRRHRAIETLDKRWYFILGTAVVNYGM